jgi:hypothetical protein
MPNCRSLCGQATRLWREFVFSDRADTLLARSKFGESSGVRSAAWLWDNVRDGIE